jgi:hypothetical protein
MNKAHLSLQPENTGNSENNYKFPLKFKRFYNMVAFPLFPLTVSTGNRENAKILALSPCSHCSPSFLAMLRCFFAEGQL